MKKEFLIFFLILLFNQTGFSQMEREVHDRKANIKVKSIDANCLDAKNYSLIAAKVFINDPTKIFPFDLENLDKAPPFNPEPPKEFATIRAMSGYSSKAKGNLYMLVDDKGRIGGLIVPKTYRDKIEKTLQQAKPGYMQNCMKDCGDSWACLVACAWDRVERALDDWLFGDMQWP